MTIEMLTPVSFGSKPVTLTDTHSHRSIAVVHGGGGTGQVAVRGLEARLGSRNALSYGLLDTRIPPSMPSHRVLVLEPGALPHAVTPTIAQYLPLLGLDARTYEQLVPLVSADGLSQIPALGFLSALLKFDLLKERLRRDFDEAAQSCQGATRPVLLTIASAAGGTGTPATRALGLAARTVLHEDLLWIHALVATPLLPAAAQTRRTQALEHQQLQEFVALMRSGATLTLPDVHAPIAKPGPDHLLVLTSSLEAPRTFEEVLDELAGVIANFLR